MSRRHRWIPLALALVALTTSARGDVVVIATATIGGTVQVADLIVTNLQMQATSPGLSTASATTNPNTLVAPYTLTVAFPQGATPTYTVQPIAVRTDANRDLIRLDAQTVQVTEAQDAERHFSLPDPGFIEATIVVQGGGTLNSATISASKGSQLSQTSTQPVNGFRFPVVPNTGISVSGTAFVFNGTNSSSVSLLSQQVNVAPGEIRAVSWTIQTPAPPPPPPSGNGAIGGAFRFEGLVPLTSASISASGTTSRSVGLSAPPNIASYLIGSLAPGTYSLSASVNLNSGDDSFSFPSSSYQPSRSGLAVANDQTTTVDIAAVQSYVNGVVLLTGLSALPSMTFGQVLAEPADTQTGGGNATDRVNTSTGAFDLIVSEGNWLVRRINSLQLQRTDPFLSETISSYIDFRTGRVVAATSGATAALDFDLPVGELTYRVSLAGGGVLSFPSISGSCTARDPQTNALLWQYNFNSSTNQQNVTEGRVSLVGPGGVCSVTGSIRVNNIPITIPAVTLTVIPGVTQDVDVGGPQLSLDSPAPGTIVGTNQVLVAGTAADDTAVASVRINGQTVPIAPTGNPGEVSFSQTVTLAQRGPNVIATVATDVANPAKSTTDSRTVYWDEAPPVASFTPANGTSTQLASVLVQGTADDDAGVQRVMVNGVQVTLTDTFNPARPNEVAFSATVPLNEGTNQLHVSVTDISNRTSLVTHVVTRVVEQPTALHISDASGVHGGSTAVSATLTAGGAPVEGRTVKFAVFGEEWTATTGTDGVASFVLSLAGRPAGTHQIQGQFAGDANYTSSSGAAPLQIGKATATLTLGGLTATFDGSPKPVSVTTNPGDLAGVTVTYDGGSEPPAGAGSYAVVASLADANYEAADATGTLIVGKATITVSWAKPASIVVGSALGASQLNAVASIAGSFEYSPAAGAIPDVGRDQELAVVFTPADAANYESKSASVRIDVLYSTGACLGDSGHAVLQPVNADGTSIFKSRATVPVKFRVCNANGQSIATPAVVSSFALYQVLNSVTAAAVNETPESATPDATFRWDPYAQQWIFNLQTKSLSANRTYRYRITLRDGSTIEFQFGLK